MALRKSLLFSFYFANPSTDNLKISSTLHSWQIRVCFIERVSFQSRNRPPLCWCRCPRLLSSGSLSSSLPPASFLALSHWLVTALSSIYPQPTAVTSLSPSGAMNHAGALEAPLAGTAQEFACSAEGCPSQGGPQALVSPAEGKRLDSLLICFVEQMWQLEPMAR